MTDKKMGQRGLPRQHIPKLHNHGLSYRDVCLIGECKEERDRLRRELDMLTSLENRDGPLIKRMRRELRELTDAKLAEKFECSVFAVRQI